MTPYIVATPAPGEYPQAQTVALTANVPNIPGGFTQLAGAPSKSWQCVNYTPGGGYIACDSSTAYVSADGSTWTSFPLSGEAINGAWQAVLRTADAVFLGTMTHIYRAAYDGTGLVSELSGVECQDLSLSPDGTVYAAIVNNQRILRRLPGTSTWAAFGSPVYQQVYHGVFANEQGDVFAVARDSSNVFKYSQATGLWSIYASHGISSNAESVVALFGGRVLIVGAFSSPYCRISYDSGATWSNITQPSMTDVEGLCLGAGNALLAADLSTGKLWKTGVGGTIIYTLDGSDPVYSPLHGTAYSSPISLPSSMTIKAIAVLSGASSAVLSFPYTITQKALFVGLGGAWKEVLNSWVGSGGSWKPVSEVSAGSGGGWK